MSPDLQQGIHGDMSQVAGESGVLWTLEQSKASSFSRAAEPWSEAGLSCVVTVALPTGGSQGGFPPECDDRWTV